MIVFFSGTSSSTGVVRRFSKAFSFLVISSSSSSSTDSFTFLNLLIKLFKTFDKLTLNNKITPKSKTKPRTI